VLVRIQPGVMALPGVADRSDIILRAATRNLAAVISHESAGRILGLNPIVERLPTVSVPHRSTNRFEGVKVHQLTDLNDSHITERNGLRVTTAERTLIDLASTTSASRLQWILEDGLQRSLINGPRLESLFAALARKGKPGVKKMRQVIENTLSVEIAADSVLERKLVELINQNGLPMPVAQYSADWLRPSNGRADFAYLEERLIIEVDGRRWHTRTASFEADRRRDNEAQLAGWRVLRFTWEAVSETPLEVVYAIRRALNGVS